MPLIQLRDVSFGYQTAAKPLFDELTLTIQRGECHLIHGHTGCGKSTLLKLLMGVMERPFGGERLSAPDTRLGVVMQDPNVQLLRQTLGAEVAFALENLGVVGSDMLALVREALRQVGLYISLDTPISSLSLGQRYRLMIAAQLVLKPNLLLLDEPWAQLDDQGVRELSQLLSELQALGIAIVIVEHHRAAFAQTMTHRWELCKGGLTALPLHHPDQHVRLQPRWRQCDTRSHSSVEVLHSDGFTLAFREQQKLFESVGLSLASGEICALIGDNGCGKSTLLKSLAGIQSNIDPVGIKVLGKRPKLGGYGADLALLHQRPSRQLFENTVIEEMQFSLKRYGLATSAAIEMLGRLGLTTLAQASPHTLSYGQQHLIALASLACLQPKLLLLDDPFAGLDSGYYHKVVELIVSLSEQGTAVVVASHRPVVDLPVDRVWRIEQRRLSVEQAGVQALSSEYSRVG